MDQRCFNAIFSGPLYNEGVCLKINLHPQTVDCEKFGRIEERVGAVKLGTFHSFPSSNVQPKL